MPRNPAEIPLKCRNPHADQTAPIEAARVMPITPKSHPNQDDRAARLTPPRDERESARTATQSAEDWAARTCRIKQRGPTTSTRNTKAQMQHHDCPSRRTAETRAESGWLCRTGMPRCRAPNPVKRPKRPGLRNRRKWAHNSRRWQGWEGRPQPEAHARPKDKQATWRTMRQLVNLVARREAESHAAHEKAGEGG
jgi:hypothetical protein